jgi:branched-subunit amino acid aminotransferase/4-amino-4-deoxychorismate lyase
MPSPRWVLSGTRVVGAGQAVVPVWSEAVRWGEGVFETVGADRGGPLLWPEHAERLAASAGALGWPSLRLPDGAALGRLLAREKLTGPAAVRVVALRVGSRIRVLAWAEAYRPPRRARLQGIALLPVSLAAGPHAGVKTTSHLLYRRALAEARQAGADAALLLDLDGVVREGDHANVFVGRGGRVATPPAPARCLPGVVRSWCLGALAASGVVAEERELRLDEVMTADEVWMTSSLAGVVPVRAIGDRPLPGRGGLVRLLERCGVPAPGRP